MNIPRWQDVYDDLCDEDGNCPFSSNKIMQDEIDELRKALTDTEEALDKLANGYAGNAWDVGLRDRLKKAHVVLSGSEVE